MRRACRRLLHPPPCQKNGLRAARPFYTPQHTATQLIAFRNAVKTGPVSLQGRPQTQLNAFRNAVKTGPVSERGRPPERAERVSKCREKRGRVIPLGQPHTGRIARVGRFFPKSASCFQSRPFLERVGRFFPESASCFQSRPASPFLSAGAAVQRPSGSARQAAELLRSSA